MLQILVSIVSFVAVIGILVIIHELGHFLTAKKFGIRVEEFALGMPPRLVSRKIGDTVYALNAVPIGGYVKLEGENGEDEVRDSSTSFQNKPPWQRFLVLLAGSAVHFIFAIVLFWGLIFSQGQLMPTHSVEINSVSANTPASEAGIAAGDIVVAIDDERVYVPADFLTLIESRAGKTVDLAVMKAGLDTITHVELTPRTDPPAGQGRTGVVITESSIAVPVSFLEAGRLGVQFTFTIVDESFSAISGIFTHLVQKASIPSDISGPVGIASISGDVARQGGLIGLISLLGILAANLAVLNLFPFPGLDGGRIVFVLLEWVRGKRLAAEKEAMVHGVGIALLFLFIAVVTYRDVLKLFGVG
ncbi:hypothetical protein AUK40_05265 [Candidatus Wirthbacteria bacterium CG2_30_54_11]|uniref:PDZ domain-containing protein n=1 Tax=Candidatus Wirthbacteria bacterium CG2_30_54_11 TaxID=1817892 RepID=A0A1J5IV39_9BACT|nr:MAG: hypothetical protein AUK40_05265 [Candidatus Wirthbacteria bacterium CG2_30_54_11]